MVEISVQFSGFQEALRKIDGNTLLAAPLRRALTQSALLVEGNAKRLVPVDTGNLRRSITYRVDSRPIPLFAEIGTNAPYAVFVHEGRKAGKMPPTSALLGWARRHGRNPFAVARSIGRRGIRGKPFLRNALTQARGQIQAFLSDAAREIEAAWKS